MSVAPPPAPPKAEGPVEIKAELIASDASWGNTEGPALDAQNNLYFSSRGTYHGIIKWNAKVGAARWADVATGAGPCGLWIDDAGDMFVTATDERELLKVTQDKEVSTVAKGFEKDPQTAKGSKISSSRRTARRRSSAKRSPGRTGSS